MWVRTGLVRKQHGTARRQVPVVRVHDVLIMRSEIVNYCASSVDFEDTVSKINSTCICVKSAVSCHEVNISGGVGCGRHTTLPNTALSGIPAVAIRHHLLQTRGIISKYPSVVWTLISVAGERDVYNSID